MSFYENEPQYVAYAKGPGDEGFTPVPVTIDSKPEAKQELSHRVNVPVGEIEIDGFEERQ